MTEAINYTTKAIQLAIKGGWNQERSIGGDKKSLELWHIQAMILLDPDFWQALGVALGWKYCKLHAFTGSQAESEICEDCQKEWLYHANRCFNWIMEGKNPDDFFKELINK